MFIIMDAKYVSEEWRIYLLSSWIYLISLLIPCILNYASSIWPRKFFASHSTTLVKREKRKSCGSLNLLEIALAQL